VLEKIDIKATLRIGLERLFQNRCPILAGRDEYLSLLGAFGPGVEKRLCRFFEENFSVTPFAYKINRSTRNLDASSTRGLNGSNIINRGVLLNLSSSTGMATTH